MSRLHTALATLAISVMTAFAAQAVPVANMSITAGTFDIEDGDTLIISGNYNGDFSGMVTIAPGTPLVFGATFDLHGNRLFEGELGPAPTNALQIALAAFGLVGVVDDLTGGAFTAGANYVRDGFERSDPTDVLDFGTGELFVSYTGGPTGVATVAGTFTAIITQTNFQGPSLTDQINMGLYQLDLLGTLGGVVFPTDGTVTFETEVIVTPAVVPLPAGLPLLLAGLLCLVFARRRQAT